MMSRPTSRKKIAHAAPVCPASQARVRKRAAAPLATLLFCVCAPESSSAPLGRITNPTPARATRLSLSRAQCGGGTGLPSSGFDIISPENEVDAVEESEGNIIDNDDEHL